MGKYRARNGHSGVREFEIGRDFIRVCFEGGPLYEYDYETTGEDNVEYMKKLGRAGRGLSTYISRFVRDRYAKRLK